MASGKKKIKSLAYAMKRIRELEKAVNNWREIAEQFDAERNTLAMLAATGPAFFNSREVLAAKELRDKLLARLGMNPDGSFRNVS